MSNRRIRRHLAKQSRAMALALTTLTAIGFGEALPAQAPVSSSAPGQAAAQFDGKGPRTIIERQMFRQTETASILDAAKRPGTATLVNLNPNANAWFLLTLAWSGAARPANTYHIENPEPARQQLHLAAGRGTGISVSRGSETIVCDLWSTTPMALDSAKRSSLPYEPLCNGRLYLRNQVEGRRTDLERITDFLRDHVWRGESVIGFVRETFYPDAFREAQRPVSLPQQRAKEDENTPQPAAVRTDYASKAIVPTGLGIDIIRPASGVLGFGRWYPLRDMQGIYLSLMQPQAIGDEIVAQDKGVVSTLDSMEASATDYLVAFDVSRFELGFALGTDHPRLGWSARVPDSLRDAHSAGPDGFDSAAPLARTGIVSPAILNRVVATFTGGFKREHGAFRYGDLAKANSGSHYGFVEEGVVFSKLQPGLATLYSMDDGSVHMRTWSVAEDALLPRIRFARQNGVPLVESNSRTNRPVPGPLVTKWGPGNWSGSADEKLRTLRAGACLQEAGSNRFLIYGYFSTATPSAMAEVFRAYNCSYAMLLDMNALEHTYLAVYRRENNKMAVEHLISGMAEVDKMSGGELIPRFIGFPDNRDFFYLVKRRSGP